EVLFVAHQCADGHITALLRKLTEPWAEKILPQSGAGADGDGRRKPAGLAHRTARLFREARQGCSMPLEALAGAGYRAAGPLAQEQARAQPLLQAQHPCADGGLRDVQSVRSAHEAARFDDGEECACQLGVHGKAAPRRYATTASAGWAAGAG